MKTIFITGGTGYIGTRLIKALQKEGNYHIKALARKGSEQKLPVGCEVVEGNALDANTFTNTVKGVDVFIQLVGVAHPSPSKKLAFKQIDLVSVQQAAIAIKAQHVPQVVYVSVSQYPSNIMKDYQAVRAEGESLLQSTGAKCSFVRPWYVLGPGHWWPILLMPLYWLAWLFPSAREKARQQGLVSLRDMIKTLVFATKNPPKEGVRVYTVPDIRSRNF